MSTNTIEEYLVFLRQSDLYLLDLWALQLIFAVLHQVPSDLYAQDTQYNRERHDDIISALALT